MGYSFTAQWLKGALNNASDALSRNPVTDPSPQDLLAETELDYPWHHHQLKSEP